MKLYISKDPLIVIKNNYPSIFEKKLLVIDGREYSEKNDINLDNENHRFIFYKYVKNKFISTKNGNHKAVIYILNTINANIVSNINIFLDEHNINYTEKILIDYLQNTDTSLYQYFDKII